MLRAHYCIAVIITVLFAAGCAESSADRAAKTALASSAQRHFATCRDYATWAKAAGRRTDTWQDSFDKHDEAIKEEEAIASALREVVLTKRYALVGAVLRKAVAIESDYLRARRNSINQGFKASTSSDRAAEYGREAQESIYSRRTYLELQIKALKESREALIQAIAFEEAADEAGKQSLASLDTLRALTVSARLLPDPGVPEMPVSGGSENSVLTGSKSLIRVRH